MTTTYNRNHGIFQIMLPGPVVSASQITISSETDTPSGQHVTISRTFRNDGTTSQITREINREYSAWHPFLGCDVLIDYGKGPIHRNLDEQFGEMFLENS